MTKDPKIEIAALQSMTASQLRKRYRELFQEESRSGNRQWLFRRCAWRIQALAEGDITQRAKRIHEKAMAIANDADLRIIPPRDPKPDPGLRTRAAPVQISEEDRIPLPGTVFERTYKGKTYLITVRADGFECDGKTYKSLSATAYAITGSHWNGFHFFRESLNYAKRETRHAK